MLPGVERAGERKGERGFLRKDLLWWISPILILLVLIAVFLIVVEGSTLAPLMYDMF
jgi:hypothetical protein